MDCLVLPFLRLVLLAAVALVCACEPISLVPMGEPPPDSGSDSPDGGDELGGKEGPDGGEPDAGPDGGRDGGIPLSEDAGPDGGLNIPVRPLGDGGVDARMTAWSDCEDGWQSRTVLPLGADRGYPQFALDADGEAYFVEYTDAVLRVVTTKPWRVFAETGFAGGQWWLGGIRVDAAGEVHLAISPRSDDLAQVVPTDFLHHTGGRWEHARLMSGLVRAHDLDAQGRLHAISLVDAVKHRLNHVQGRIGDLSVIDTGIELGSLSTRVSLRADGQGKAHVTYEYDAVLGRAGIFYATNASGTWVREQVAAAGANPVIAVSPAGVPHILWAKAGVLSLSSRSAPGEWSTSILPFESSSGELRFSASGVIHVLRNLGKRLEYRNDARGDWAPKTVIDLESSLLDSPFFDWALEVDEQGRAHVMYTELVEAQEPMRMLRRIGYSRQCP
ncbi:hypothetical protein HUA78_08485 [Myxococcus sp. CA033]|uniref:hypothetical protein n=1 Tax=Myxococcus sp. CA033 TaxID=2741516 RepID=UPI00157B4D56|nr:hypothetical protein [Myxococcus sp. CA033]